MTLVASSPSSRINYYNAVNVYTKKVGMKLNSQHIQLDFIHINSVQFYDYRFQCWQNLFKTSSTSFSRWRKRTPIVRNECHIWIVINRLRVEKRKSVRMEIVYGNQINCIRFDNNIAPDALSKVLRKGRMFTACPFHSCDVPGNWFESQHTMQAARVYGMKCFWRPFHVRWWFGETINL